MKCKNIKFSCISKNCNGDILKCKFFVSKEAKDKWCNAQYDPKDESVIVLVFDFNTDKLLETWGA